MAHRARLISFCVALASCAHDPWSGVERRYVAGPGDWAFGIAVPDTHRLPFSSTEAAQLEVRLRARMHSGDRKLVPWLRKHWSHYLLLFQKIGSTAGDQVFITGFSHDAIKFEHREQPPAHITAQTLLEIVVEDGGCIIWRVVYDVTTKRFDDARCNGY